MYSNAHRSTNLPANYLASLIQYASIIPKEDSASGPVKVVKLIDPVNDG